MKTLKAVNKHQNYIILILLLCFIDQITKFVIVLFLKEPIVVTSFFNLVKVANTGISFGMFSNYGETGKNILLILTTGIIIFLIYLLFKNKRRWEKYALTLIIGGAIGNLIDRFYYGWVVDFLDFHLSNYHWPAFNFADTWIVIGGILLFCDVFVNRKKTT